MHTHVHVYMKQIPADFVTRICLLYLHEEADHVFNKCIHKYIHTCSRYACIHRIEAWSKCEANRAMLYIYIYIYTIYIGINTNMKLHKLEIELEIAFSQNEVVEQIRKQWSDVNEAYTAGELHLMRR